MTRDPTPGPGFGEFSNDQESIFERIARSPAFKRAAVVDHGSPGQWHGAKAQTAVPCTSDEEVCYHNQAFFLLLSVI
jgi:RNA exonuclease 1